MLRQRLVRMHSSQLSLQQVFGKILSTEEKLDLHTKRRVLEMVNVRISITFNFFFMFSLLNREVSFYEVKNTLTV